jgi:hypothetical protein
VFFWLNNLTVSSLWSWIFRQNLQYFFKLSFIQMFFLFFWFFILGSLFGLFFCSTSFFWQNRNNFLVRKKTLMFFISLGSMKTWIFRFGRRLLEVFLFLRFWRRLSRISFFHLGSIKKTFEDYFFRLVKEDFWFVS